MWSPYAEREVLEAGQEQELSARMVRETFPGVGVLDLELKGHIGSG